MKPARALLEIQNVVEHFVIISSTSVYRDERGRTPDEAKTEDDVPQMPIPIFETQPTVSPGPATYSTRKVALERTMLDGCRSILSVIRPCAIYGPHSKHPREWWFLKRMLDGRKRIPLRCERSRFQTSATANIARVITTAIDASFTGILHAGDADSPSVSEIGNVIAAEYRWDGSYEFVPLTTAVGHTPWSMQHPFLLNMDAAAALDYEPDTSYGIFGPSTCRWLERATAVADWRTIFPVLLGYPELFDYAAEDAFFDSLT